MTTLMLSLKIMSVLVTSYWLLVFLYVFNDTRKFENTSKKWQAILMFFVAVFLFCLSLASVIESIIQ